MIQDTSEESKDVLMILFVKINSFLRYIFSVLKFLKFLAI